MTLCSQKTHLRKLGNKSAVEHCNKYLTELNRQVESTAIKRYLNYF